jgi:hypothetical protein
MSDNEQVASGAELRRKARPFLKCPSGNVYQVYRPKASTVLKSGELPENFLTTSLIAMEERIKKDEPLVDEDLLTLERARVATVSAALLNPRVVANPTEEDEIQYEDIPPDDAEFIYKWIRNGSPDIPVGLKGGDVSSIEDIGNFSEDTQGKQRAGAGDALEDESKAVGASGNS